MKTIYKVMTTAVLTGALVGGGVWSAAQAAPAQKSTTKSAPASVNTNKAGVKSVSHQNISLGISKVTYDGNVVLLEVQRDGKGLIGGITDSKWDDQKDERILEKGAISTIELFINGVSVNTYGGSNLWERPSLSWEAGSTKDKVLISMADATWLGEKASLKALPDQFKLTAKIKLEGVNELYTLDIPVQKEAGSALKLSPNLTKKSGDLSMTLKKASVTSQSTRLQLIVKGQEANSTILYDFYDDQGKRIDTISGGRGTDENGAKGVMYNDFLLNTQGKALKSITVKPFKPVFAEPGATSGQFKVDDKGDVVKEYIQDLEMNLKIK
ncbi:DUF5643 domain-containing protein [Paenibacillus tuaregi]|uniref:DUF5643 domain-containing protein n=1 Tax=Paenibacillus tuaregi TaxID=1816681 RepID=UPI000837F825|nr:DUF5643 domain-containing protein [Paenibacillus tuaregi]